MLAERFDVFVDVGAERFDPRLCLDGRRFGVGRGDGAAERIGEIVVDLIGDVIERAVLVEPHHVDRPFDRLAVAADREPAVALARDGDDAAIKFRRQRPVDLDLGLARGFALGERRIIEKRKAHRALDLQRAVAGEKHRRRVGVDAPHLLVPAP